MQRARANGRGATGSRMKGPKAADPAVNPRPRNASHRRELSSADCLFATAPASSGASLVPQGRLVLWHRKPGSTVRRSRRAIAWTVAAGTTIRELGPFSSGTAIPAGGLGLHGPPRRAARVPGHGDCPVLGVASQRGTDADLRDRPGRATAIGAARVREPQSFERCRGTSGSWVAGRGGARSHGGHRRTWRARG